MKEGRLLDFSIQCSPAAMIGYIQFAIPITVAKSHYRSVLERMYSEFQANILYSPSVIESEDRLTFVLFSENVFTVDSAMTRQYYDYWIIKEIDQRLSPQPLLRKSISVDGL